MDSVEVLRAICDQRVLPVLRLDSQVRAVEAARRVLDGGLRVVELTCTTPGWDLAVSHVSERGRSGAVIGVGTVTGADDARRALDAGASFLVSPYPVPEVREVAQAGGVTFLEGCFSVGELAAATARGPAKLFPASTLGPAHLRSVLQVLPGATIVPTGGIRLTQLRPWFEAGAAAVGVGTDLLVGNNLERIEELVSA
ncbi:MAG: 2-dehydro-3-deoxyphosphogluconate aldolase / (4S)-4-hydroxy-2-oxoglutarate aldolase [Actinomycetota bacterium]|nr:2-dehydro-3-deoxyphosphogluconate aldolase / (4S)-4-hydroxy-2-oxoglutarate aldolase [Actinomycetota bacterium]